MIDQEPTCIELQKRPHGLCENRVFVMGVFVHTNRIIITAKGPDSTVLCMAFPNAAASIVPFS